MGALAHAVTVGAKLRGIVQTSAFVETSPASANPGQPTVPVKENPYREARERARARRKIVVPEGDTQDLRAAVADLLLLMNRAETLSSRIADEEIPSEPAAFDTAEETDVQAHVMSREDYSQRISQEAFQPELAQVGAPAAPSLDTYEQPLRINPAETVRASVDSYDPATRERVAAGLVTFHGGMTVPKVAPFILEPSSRPALETED
jgi:hypothetical protein